MDRIKLAWLLQFIGLSTVLSWTQGGIGLMITILVWAATGFTNGWTDTQRIGFLLALFIVATGIVSVVWQNVAPQIRGKPSGTNAGEANQPEQFDPLSLHGQLQNVGLEGIAIEEPFIMFHLVFINASYIPFTAALKGKPFIAGIKCNQEPTLESGQRLAGGRSVLSIRQPISAELAGKVQMDVQTGGLIECNLGGMSLGLTSEKTGQHYESRPLLEDRFYIRGPMSFGGDNPIPETFLFPTTVGPSAAYLPDGRYRVSGD